jgi:hypothetical protein
MLTALLIMCAIWAGLILAMTVFFDVWAYLTTKDYYYVLKVWTNRHKTHGQLLSPRQASLLRTLSLAERGLGYFGLFVVIPIYLLYIST